MKKTAAIKAARRAVYVAPRGKSYVVVGPWRDNDLDGPITESPATDWWDAQRKRTEWCARVALTLMGWDNIEAYSMCYDQEGSVNELVDRALMAKG
jgi:hypothetical protein